ncbi:hypothetical protein F511_36102 [Dorcoceras hygrometricum]|uniref:Uncharacterized protein n=1 Tax=Dorcoceras hygrometricum TaxID=472368 RepID=A0A2Z7BMZ8_9LAMI|nr:hypothetical protein F511_36102 [Dorcoceras hygrometricum]
MKRRRAKESADGLALMTSSVTSSSSADGLREQSQDTSSYCLTLKYSAGDFALIPVARSSRELQWIQSQDSSSQQDTMDPVASFSTMHPSRKDPDTRKADVAKHCIQTQSIQSTKISAEDEFSRSDKSAAKQLTIYESWMSTAELNSNGENDKKPAKEKDTSTIPCRYFTEHI